MKRVFLIFLLCAAPGLLGFALPAHGEGNAVFWLHYLAVEKQRDNTLLAVSLGARQAAPLQSALKEGSLLNLTLECALEERRALLPNLSVDQRTLILQLRFDPLTREYLLLRQDEPPLHQRDLTGLLNAALADLSIPLAPPATLEPGREYNVTLTLGVRHADVPPWLRQTLFFWSWDVIAPVSFSLSFTAPEAVHDSAE